MNKAPFAKSDNLQSGESLRAPSPMGVSDSLIISVDIASAILNLRNVEKDKQSSEMRGLDVTSILQDPRVELRDCCLIEVDEDDLLPRAQ